MSRDNTWSNQDGLEVGFGARTEDIGAMRVIEGGTVKQYVIELVDAAVLEDTDIVTVASLGPVNQVVIPRGALIRAANFVVTTVFTSEGAATLDIGTYEAGGDGSSTGDDVAAGIDADIALTALDAVGDTVACNGSLVNGVLSVGSVSNSDVVVVFGFEAAAFTAGAGTLYLEVVVPQGSMGRTIAN